MKVVNQQIEIVSFFNTKGEIRPMKFKVLDTDSSQNVIIVDKLIGRKTEKVAAQVFEIFRCQSIINNSEKVYELRYDREKLNWYLYKI